MSLGAAIEIPKRALFKAAEVCDLIQVQPYVLRSWEAEFPELGVTKGGGGSRVYRRVDVEQVARIKHLLLVEGLTLAGARRRLEEEASPIGADAPVIDELIGENARERLTEIKRGLRSILELLEASGVGVFQLAPPMSRLKPSAPPGRHKAARGKSRSRGQSSPRAASARRRT